jgi:NitT/TauT family transport system substrate-binding protein
MSARVGLTPEAYKPLLKGTHLIDLAEGRTVFQKAPGFASLYGSSDIANDFNVKNAVYKEKLDVASFIDPSLMNDK